MSNNTNSPTAAYVELDVLNSWSSQMENINEQAIAVLDSFTTTVRELENYWMGNSATGFLNASEKLMTRAKIYHNKMKSTSNFLIEVARTMDSQ